MTKLKSYERVNRSVYCLIGMLCVFMSSIQAQCYTHGENVWKDSWVSCVKTSNPNPARPVSHWLLVEFPTPESITETHIWNANRNGQSERGARNISIDYSVDGSTWIFGGTMTLAKAPETNTYAGIPGLNFGGLFIKKILITINSTYGDPSCASLAELKFDIDQTSCYGVVDECGVCNGGGKIRWFRDEDNDGMGDELQSIYSCSQPSGYVQNGDDVCDDVAYGWDVISQIFKDNKCIQCHGANGQSGLNLLSYETAIGGGTKCGPAIWQGTRLSSIIFDNGYSGCTIPIQAPSMNYRIGQLGESINSEEFDQIQAWINSGATKNCDCIPSDPDTDNDGVCDQFDTCPSFNNNLIGTSCNDGNPCTINDSYSINCNCEGIPAIDTDNDGVCDSQDALPLNPCSADGVIDGIEAHPWTGSLSNDCDNDGVILAQGDIDDFAPCINDEGYTPSVSCECGPAALKAGGTFEKTYGVIGGDFRASGLPDGILSGYISFFDTLSLVFPPIVKGEQICVTLGFSSADGLAVIELNGVGSYRIPNAAGLVNYELQEFCFETIASGPQTLFITEDGDAGIKVDGSSYMYCPCTPIDPLYNSPECQCPTNQESSPIEYHSHLNVGGIPSNAAGYPDGILTGNVSSDTDELVLSFPSIEAHAKICISAGFNVTTGGFIIEQSNQIYSFKNLTGLANYDVQEFCFSAPAVILDNTLTLTDNGAGSPRIDGGYMIRCKPCAPGALDSDNDGICNQNDLCPFSPTGDSDGDGYCDDVDRCQGFDDNYDSDGDGNPNGCDSCFGFDDDIDTDGDGIPNGCDICEGSDDALDFDQDGIPNGCDVEPCQNFIYEITSPLIVIDLEAHIQLNTNGYVTNNANIQYTAGKQILMLEGFSVDRGATFLAHIGPCSP